MQNRILGLVLGLVCLGSAAAEAQTRVIERRGYGAWDYVEMYNDRDGSGACSIGTYWNWGRQLRLTAMSEPRALVISVEDPSWSMPAGTSGSGTLWIDGQRFTAEFSASSRRMALVRIGNARAGERFLLAFADGAEMVLELPWGQVVRAVLSGTAQALSAMNSCAGRI